MRCTDMDIDTCGCSIFFGVPETQQDLLLGKLKHKQEYFRVN